MPICVRRFTSGCMVRFNTTSKNTSEDAGKSLFRASLVLKKWKQSRGPLPTFLMNRIWRFSTVWQGRCSMVWKKRDEQPVSWESLKGFIVPEILRAPKTGGDPAGGWPVVHERLVRYFLRNVTG